MSFKMKRKKKLLQSAEEKETMTERKKQVRESYRV